MGNLVTISILNWNRKEETCRAINSALLQTYSNIEIVVVDNGSTDGSHEYIKNKYPNIKCIGLDRNYGCPGGRNRSIDYCNGDFIFYLDNDGVLHEKAVENAVKIIAEYDNIAIVTGLVRDFEDESEIIVDYSLDKLDSNESNLFQGGISMHRKSIYSQVGCFPDDYMYGGEETFMSYRVIDADYRIVKSDQVVLWHKKSMLARNIKKESIQMWGNTLMNSYQLYPLEYFIMFLLYFLTKYPFYALKHGFLKEYLNAVFGYFSRFSKYERKAVSRFTYKKIRKLAVGN